MDWLLKGIVIWLSLDVLIIATSWYLSQTISQVWPVWWRKVIVDAPRVVERDVLAIQRALISRRPTQNTSQD